LGVVALVVVLFKVVEEVLALIEQVQLLLEHIQYQQLFKLVVVLIPAQSLQLVVQAHHHILGHQSLLLVVVVVVFIQVDHLLQVVQVVVDGEQDLEELQTLEHLAQEIHSQELLAQLQQMVGVIVVDKEDHHFLLMDLLVVVALAERVLLAIQLAQLLVKVGRVFNFQQHLEILNQE
jgi:hypothetical protein